MKGFNDTLEHSVWPARDYPFATEVYPVYDSRYKVTELFKSMLAEKVGVRPYNVKVSLIRSAEEDFNVYVYFRDIRKAFPIEEAFMPAKHKRPYNAMFMKALQRCPVPELDGKELNPNGIFFEDFRKCARSKSLKDAEPSLKKHWQTQEPRIAFTVCWDDACYLFFEDRGTLSLFCGEKHIRSFKQEAYELLRPYDKDSVWDIDSLVFILDVYENYRSVGMRDYFNSDAMYAGKVI